MRPSAIISFKIGLSLLGSLGSLTVSRCFLCSFSSLCSLSLSLCFSLSSLLLGHLLSYGLVDLLLGIELLSSGLFASLHIAFANSLQALLLALLPGIKLLLSSSFIECTFLHTSTEMLHKIHALALKDVAYCVGGLSAYLYPMKGTLEIQIYGCRIGVGIVSTNLLSKFTITWCSHVGDDNAIESIALTTAAL